MRRPLLAFLCCSLLIAAGCSTNDTEAVTTGDTTVPTSSTAEATPEPTSAQSSTVTEREATVDECRRVADLESDEELQRWRVVNDGVMGGQSSASIEIAQSILTIEGEIVTDGGGFSSVRLQLDEPLGDTATLRFRLRTDGRQYELTASDAAEGRDPRISHPGRIPAIGGDEWEEVEVDLAVLESSIFGQPVSTDSFDPATAVEIGVILADGTDGPFRFELDWISACP